MIPTDATEQSNQYFAIISELKPLIADRREEEVIRKASTYRDRAIADGQPLLASLCSAFLGSTLSAAGRSAEALESFEDAYKYMPSRSAGRVLARELLIRGDTARAQEIISKVDSSGRPDPVEEHVRITFHGFANLLSGTYDEARKSLVAAIDAALAGNVPSLEWDLTLVAEMIRRDVDHKLCRRYLAEIETRISEGGALMRRAVALLRDEIDLRDKRE